MSVKKASVAKLIADYFRKARVPQRMKPDAFWKQLERKHGQAARDFGDVVNQRERGIDVDPYPLKNATEALSLDITGQYESRLYRDFAEWLANEGFKPDASILDLGCGNGVFTCLLATLFPAATIVAVDVNAEGIEIAQSLASQLGLTNIEFIVGDINDLQRGIPVKPFDLVIAVKVIHEVLNKPELRELTGLSISSMSSIAPDDNNRTLLSGIHRYLGTGSSLICLDRWSTPESFGWWIRTAESARLRISLDLSFMLKTAESGDPCTFPISVLTADDTLPYPSDEQLLSFFVYPQMNELLNKINQVEGPLAEALYASLADRSIVASLEATYRDNSGTESTTLFMAGAICGLYSSWTTGARTLFLAPSVAVGSMIGHFIDRASSLEATCDVTHHEHDCGQLLAQYGIRLAN